MQPTHKLLLEYLPQTLQGIQEFTQITKTEQKEADGLWAEFGHALDDVSIVTATPEGLARYEEPLGILPKTTATPDERRFVLLARYNEQLPYTRRILEQRLEALCGVNGYSVDVDPTEKTIRVLVARTARTNFDEVAALLERVIPCNMMIYLSIKYNQHTTFGDYTHEELSAHTHYDLRNEVLT